MVNPARVALRVYVPAAAVPVILQPAKVATPAAAFTGLVVQASVPWVLPPLPAVYEAMDRVTGRCR